MPPSYLSPSYLSSKGALPAIVQVLQSESGLFNARVQRFYARWMETYATHIRPLWESLAAAGTEPWASLTPEQWDEKIAAYQQNAIEQSIMLARDIGE